MARKPGSKGLSEPKSRYSAARSAAAAGPEIAAGSRKLPEPETLPDGTTRYFLVLGAKGRVLLPAEMRAAMGLAEGDVLTGWLKDGELRLHSHLHGLRKVQSEAAALAKQTGYMSDELIAERRAEAVKEEEETQRWLRDRKKQR